jgi:hypothetical protein
LQFCIKLNHIEAIKVTVNKGLLILLILTALLTLAGCGSSGPGFTKPAPAPTGPFSNAALSGTYAFSATGTNTFGFFTVAGSLQADGNGHITAGMEDVNSRNGVFTNVPISGSFSVGADGRGVAILLSSISVIDLDFVLISTQHGLVIRFDSNSAASGSIDRQDSSAFSAGALQGAFAFTVSGVDAGGGNFQTAGNFSADGVGSINSGIQDLNDNGVVALGQTVTGVYTVGSNGRGVAVLNTTAGTLTFAFYVVDSTHLKLIETDNAPALSGDAFRQQGTFSNPTVSGTYAFTVGGSSSGPFAAGGIFTADGNGNITTGVEDINDAGSISQSLALSGAYTMAANGRGTLALNSSSRSANFVIYPSTGGLQMLQTDSSTVSSGTAFLQQAGSLSNASVQGNFGLALSGVTAGGEFESIAQFAADGSGKMTGAIDINNVGSLSQGLALSGTYAIGANGRGTVTLKSSAGTQNIVFYVAGSSRVLALEIDSNLAAIGISEQQ